MDAMKNTQSIPKYGVIQIIGDRFIINNLYSEPTAIKVIQELVKRKCPHEQYPGHNGMFGIKAIVTHQELCILKLHSVNTAMSKLQEKANQLKLFI